VACRPAVLTFEKLGISDIEECGVMLRGLDGRLMAGL
jgi:hypothetical protein